MKLGNTSFNEESLNGLTKEEFVNTYKGKIKGIDINEAWNKVKQFTKVPTEAKSKTIRKK